MTVVQIVFCIFLLSISVCYLFTSGEQFQQGMDELKQQYYELNFDKLRDMWYTGMMRGVLKAKAKNLCESLPQNECILYSLCASDAQSLVELAKCVVTLLDERDRQIAINEEYRRQVQAGVTPVESEIFSRFPSFEHMNEELRIMLAKLETSLKSSIQEQHSMQSSSNKNENRSIIMKSLPIQPQSDEVMITHYQSSTSSSHVDKKIPANFQTVKESLLQIYPSSSTQLLTTFTRDQNDTGDQRISVEEKIIHMNVPVKIESNKGDISDKNIRSNYSKSLTSSKFMGNNREKGQQIIRSQKRRDRKNSYNKRSGKHRNRTAEGNASEQRVNLGGLNGDAFEHENLHKLQEGIAKRDEPKADITTEPLHTKMRSIKITWPKMRNESDSTHRNLRKRSGVQSGTSAINRKERRRRSSQASANKGTGTSRPSSKEPSNVKKLRIIRDHFSRLGQINEYIKRMNQENSRFLHEINMPVESRFETIEDANQNEMLNDIVAMINAFQKTGKDGPSISIMSPRLFSIVPEASRRPQLLSPTLLSFQKDGFLSVPDLLDMATNRKSDATHLVDLIVELSGAATVLNKLYEKLQPQIKEVNEIHLPAIREFERQEQNWQNVIDSYSEKQKLDLKKRGYAHLEPEQLQLIYDKPIGVLRGIDVNWTQYANMNETQREQRLEANIRQLAMFDEKLSKPIGRVKRQPQYGSAKTVGLEEGGPTYRTLSPYAFTNRIGQGLALEAVTLSPHAFIPEILFPEGVVLYTLSPRAFIGSILSPQALIGRIISPSAFRGDVLSPRALVAHVLSPEALFAEVLTPRFIEPRIISPELLIIYVLSPEFLAPHVLSDESIGVFVLSPHVLSPRLWSQDHMIVEILSPDILGGGYPESEEKK